MAAFIEFLPPRTSRISKVTCALTRAVQEWLLIALLLSSSFLSYLIVKFASFFELRPPCLWCSRVDHVLEPKKMRNLYRLLVCDSHAQEISSLSFCSSHRKLCPSQSLCLNCSSSDYVSPVTHEQHMTCSCCAYPIESNPMIAGTEISSDKILEMSVDSILPPQIHVPESELGFRKEEDDVLETNRVALTWNPLEKLNFQGFGRDDDGNDEILRKDIELYASGDDPHCLTAIVAAAEGVEKKEEHDYPDGMLFVEMRGDDKEIEFVVMGSCSSSDTCEEEKGPKVAAIDILELDLWKEKHDISLVPSTLTVAGCEEEALESCKNGKMELEIVKRMEEPVSSAEVECLDIVLPLFSHEEDHPCFSSSRKDVITPTTTSTSYADAIEEMSGAEGVFNEKEGGNGTVVREDGVATVEQLKEALLVERGALRALYVELEEERNASAEAANQTMAMINRLQGEKAAMQMEALQYQRMMEEQCEYDVEALELLNDLMVRKEKERQEMEKELEYHRKKVLDYENDSRHGCSVADVKESLADLEDERLSILEKLSILEGKLIDLNHEVANGDRNLPLLEEGEGKKVPVEEVVGELQERLQAWEAEREFVKQCVSSLNKGDKGMDVLQEILHNLRYLKNVEHERARNYAVRGTWM